MRTALLYTIGQGTPLFERYGHTLLCVREDGALDESGVCTDYGVSNAKGTLDLVWNTLRGTPNFVATQVTEKLALDTFRGEGRAIDKQVLPLSEAQVASLGETLAHEVASGWAYAYHPRTENCATHPRDRIDRVLDGKFAAEALANPLPADPRLAHYRDQLEAGLSGHAFELTVAALISGTPADSVPSAWETMYQPERLRDGVEAYLGAPVESVAQRIHYPLETSTGVGHMVLVLLAIALYTLVRRVPRVGVALTAALLGGTALLLDLLALVSVWPEFSRNWVLLMLWPTDLALPWLPRKLAVRYAQVRGAVAALLALAELVGPIHQPLLTLAVLVSLPMVGIWRGARTRVVAPKTSTQLPAAEGA